MSPIPSLYQPGTPAQKKARAVRQERDEALAGKAEAEHALQKEKSDNAVEEDFSRGFHRGVHNALKHEADIEQQKRIETEKRLEDETAISEELQRENESLIEQGEIKLRKDEEKKEAKEKKEVRDKKHQADQDAKKASQN